MAEGKFHLHFLFLLCKYTHTMLALHSWTTGFPVTPAQRYVHTTTFFQEGSGACASSPQTPENRSLALR